MPVRKATFALFVALVSSILYLVLHYVTNTIYVNVRNPFMDEVFHVPQAQRYCRGNFSYYDPKITTPPGLYILTYLRIWVRDKILMRRSDLICDTIDLRRTNHLFAIFTFVTAVLINLTYEGTHLSRRNGLRQRIVYVMDKSTSLDLGKLLFKSLAITTLPPLFFFNSLYYTDAGSLLFILLAFLFSTNDHHITAAAFGAISILFRQTNIVWLFYSAGLVAFRIFKTHSYEFNKRRGQENCLHKIIFNKKLVSEFLRKCSPYVAVGIVFIIFVIVNEGIALGDKEAHQPRLHLAQILYFLGFCSVFSASQIFNLRFLRRFLYFSIRSPLTALSTSSLIICIIAFGRYAHPYLLADNRHITFYIWRRILDRHNSYVPYLLTPVYLLSCFSIWYSLRDRGYRHTLLYVVCTLLAIVPNGLLEPRYFIVPYVFLRLNSESSIVSLSFEIGQHLTINLGMYYLFLHKTFQWAESSELQRIIW